MLSFDPESRSVSGASGTSGTPAAPVATAARALTSFVGRGATLAAVDEAFGSGARLVTLLGPPGIGKTRLAERVAGGTTLPSAICDLTEAREVRELSFALARVVGERLPPAIDATDVPELVARAFDRRGPMLLVLDNFEQLVERAAHVVERLCAGARSLRVLVTSRERLGVAGERVVEIPPLAVPDGDESAVEEIFACEAVRLYVERAAAAAGWRAPAKEVAAERCAAARDLATLVRALDGIPLAIELAAARSRVLGPSEMLARFAQRFELLAAQRSAAPGHGRRHATLRAAIDCSWNLLGPWEKAALAQCSVFAGGFTLDAAEDVVDLAAVPDAPDGPDAPHAADAPDVLTVVESLRDKSLVGGGPARFSLLVSIRDYAGGMLAARPATALAVERRHARAYLARGRAWSEAVVRRGDAGARTRLAAERDNLLAVFRRARALAPRTSDAATEMAEALGCLEPLLSVEGPFEELLSMCDEACAAAEQHALAPSLRARLYFARGNAHGYRGRLRASIEDLERACALAVADPAAADGADRAADATVAEAQAMLSARFRRSARFSDAERATERAFEAIAKAGGRRRLEGLNVAQDGLRLGELGRREEARARNEQVLRDYADLDDPWLAALAHANLAQLARVEGDLEASRRGYGRALAAFRGCGDRRFEGIYLASLGGTEWDAGDLEAAARDLAAAIELAAWARFPPALALARSHLGGVLAAQDRLDEATREIELAREAIRGLVEPTIAAAVEIGEGHLDALRARRAAASGLADEAEAHRAAAAARLEIARRSASTWAPEADDVEVGQCSDEVRFAVRMLERALAASGAPASGSSSSSAPGSRPRRALVVARDGRWFELAGGARVDLVRRGALRRILLALVERRLAASETDAGLEWPALFELGWPGERAIPDAASKRVRVAVATLRKLGLNGVIVTRDDGYLLDPATDASFNRC